MSKRFLALLSAGVMMFGLAACTGTDSTDPTASESTPVEAVPYSEKASEVKSEASEMKSEMKKEASEAKSEMSEKASELKSEMKKEASEAKSEMSEKASESK